MHTGVFLATTGSGVARASADSGGRWSVAEILQRRDVRCLATDRLKPGRVYAGTQGQGVLQSDDGGVTWQACGLAGHTVKALATSPARPGLVVAGTRPARLFVSHDAGASWEELAGFRRIPWRWLWFSPAEAPFTAYVQGIALSPVDPAVMAVGIEAGATVLSTDGGRTWSGHRRGALRDCHTLAFHARDGAWLYEAGGSGGGAACSRDGGRIWAGRAEGLDRHYGWAVAADPEQPEVWYVSASPGPFKAHGAGDAQAFIFRHDGHTWQRLAGGLPQPLNHMPYALITDPQTPGAVFAGLSNGDIWRSADRGDTWRQLPVNLKGIQRSLVML